MFLQASKSRNSVSSLVMMSPSNTAEKVLNELLVSHSLSAGALSEGKNSRSIGQEVTGLGKGTVELGFQGWPKQRKERLRSRKQHSHGQDKQVTAPARWRGLSFDLLPPLLLLFSRVPLFGTPRTAAHQASLSFTTSRSLRKLMFLPSCLLLSTINNHSLSPFFFFPLTFFILFFLFSLLSYLLCCAWHHHLSSPTGDQTRAPCSESVESTTGRSGKSQIITVLVGNLFFNISEYRSITWSCWSFLHEIDG